MNLKEELLKTLIREEVRRAILNESMPGWKAAGIPEKLGRIMLKYYRISPNIEFKEITTVPNEDQLENGHIIINVIDSENAAAIMKVRDSWDRRWIYYTYVLRRGKWPETFGYDALKKAMAKFFKPGGTLFIGKNDIPFYGYDHTSRELRIHRKKRGVKKDDPNFTTDKDDRRWYKWDGTMDSIRR